MRKYVFLIIIMFIVALMMTGCDSGPITKTFTLHELSLVASPESSGTFVANPGPPNEGKYPEGDPVCIFASQEAGYVFSTYEVEYLYSTEEVSADVIIDMHLAAKFIEVAMQDDLKVIAIFEVE